MRDGLCIVPHMSAGPRAAPNVVAASLPSPQSSVSLAQYSWALEYGQVGGHSFHYLRWESGIVEAVAEVKMPDLTAATKEAAVRTVEGSLRSMGIQKDY